MWTVPRSAGAVLTGAIVLAMLACTDSADEPDPVPTIAPSAGQVVLQSVAGSSGPAQQTITITNSGDGALTGLAATVRYPPGGPTGWLSAQLDRPTAPATLTITALATALAPGVYDADVSLSAAGASNSPHSLPVRLTVGAAPVLTLDPTAVGFTAVAGATTILPKTVQVGNTGGGVLTGLTATVATVAGQTPLPLIATLDRTTAPATLTLQPAAGPWSAGTYAAVVTVTAPEAANGPQQLPVTLTVARTFVLDLQLLNDCYPSAGATCGTASGSVTAPGIACTLTNDVPGGDCSEAYPEGAVVTLTKVAGPRSSGSGTLQVTMDADRLQRIAFFPLRSVLFVTLVGSGKSAEVLGVELWCVLPTGVPTITCNKPFEGGVFDLVYGANPRDGSFLGWSGDCYSVVNTACHVKAQPGDTVRITATFGD